MKTLFLAWQDKRLRGDSVDGTRAWLPIGRLDAEPRRFSLPVCLHPWRVAGEGEGGFQPLDAFPKFDALYESSELFPLFQNRLISTNVRITPSIFSDSICLRSARPRLRFWRSRGRATGQDNLEVFPKIQARRDGSFSCRFFLHGWRHVNAPSQHRLNVLRPGEPLQVSVELNNPATGVAVQLETPNDYFMLGWAPRYLIPDVLQAIAGGPSNVTARVVQLNPPPAPHNQRVLVALEGRLAAGYEPMSGDEFLPLRS